MRPVLLLALLLTTELISAKDKVQIAKEPSWLIEIKPDWTKKPDLKKIGNGYYLELVDEQINLLNKAVYNHYIRHIINESGIQNASEVSVRFSPEYQSVVFHYVRVIREGEVVNQLGMNEIKVIQEERDVDEYQYNGEKRAFIILKDIRKEDRIEVAYTISGFNPVFDGRFTSNLYFSNDNPILNFYKTIIAEQDRQLKFTYFNNASTPQQSISGNSKIYHWNNPVVSLWESTGTAPSWFNPYPWITVSDFQNWKEVADWGLAIYDHYKFDLPKALKDKISLWREKSKGDNDEFSAFALRYVQEHIRYLGLEIGINTHKPHSPAEVFSNGYGDCKDKALLLAMILRSENIPAYATLVNTSEKGQLINRASSPYEFDHVIVAIERPNSYIYVDPTLTNQKGDLDEAYLPAYEYTLLIKLGENSLRYIEPKANNIVRIFETLKVHFDDTSTLLVNTTYRGGRASETRRSFKTMSEKDLSDSYVDYYSSLYDGIVMQDDVASEDDSAYNVVKVVEKYNIPNVWSDDEKSKKHFETYAKSIHQALPDPSGHSSEFPISLSFPSTIYYTLEIRMPETWSFPEDKLHIANNSYEFDFKAELNGSSITLKYSLVTHKDHIPAEEIARYKKDYKKIIEILQYRLSYDKNASPGAGVESGGMNFITILYALVIACMSVFAFIYLNRRSVEVEYDRESGWKLGGWMIVLGLSLVAGAAMHAYSLLAGEYFNPNSYSIWNAHGPQFLLVVIVELTFLLLWLFSSVAVLYWFLKRRDIFPTMFTGYVVFLILSSLIMLALYSIFTKQPEFEYTVTSTTSQIVKLLVYGAIWCTYVMKSYRAKATFLRATKKDM